MRLITKTVVVIGQITAPEDFNLVELVKVAAQVAFLIFVLQLMEPIVVQQATLSVEPTKCAILVDVNALVVLNQTFVLLALLVQTVKAVAQATSKVDNVKVGSVQEVLLHLKISWQPPNVNDHLFINTL